MARLTSIEGIGEAFEQGLKRAGITSVEKLLDKGSSRKGRKELAEKTGINDKLILRWVNYADLFRIKGVAGQYAELLEAAGIDTVAELAHRKPENLAVKMAEVNEEKNLTRNSPTARVVGKWVAQAAKLPRVVEY